MVTYGRYGPSHPRLGKLAYWLNRPLYDNLFAWNKFYRPESAFAQRTGETMRAKLDSGKPVYLHPNEKIVLPVNSSDAGIAKNPASTASSQTTQHITRIDSTVKDNEHLETAWVYNRLEFRGDNFEQLALKLERWYNIKIYFEDDAARQLVFNGSLQTETVEQAFMALKEAVPFDVSINNNEVFIKSTK